MKQIAFINLHIYAIYDLHLYNLHFHTAVTKDLKNDIDGRYFVLSLLFSQTAREILKYIYIFQCLEVESHHIHIRNKTCILKGKAYIYCVIYLGL